MRFKAGNGVHSTPEGWIIDEPERGAYRIFREMTDGGFETPTPEDLAAFPGLLDETRDFMHGVMNAVPHPGQNASTVALAEQMEAMVKNEIQCLVATIMHI